MKKLTMIIVALFAAIMPALADSPLTSTQFHQAYADEPIVKTALEEGLIGALEMFADNQISVGAKLAAVNAMGWNFDGMAHSDTFFAYLSEMYGWKNVNQMVAKADVDIVITYAYMKAMDNYFDVKKAFKIADKAFKRDPRSRAIRVIRNLIYAQIQLDKDWSNIYYPVYAATIDPGMRDDFRQEACDGIMEYIGLYKGE